MNGLLEELVFVYNEKTRIDLVKVALGYFPYLTRQTRRVSNIFGRGTGDQLSDRIDSTAQD